VRYGIIGDFHKGYIRISDGKEVPKDDVEFLQELPDGELVEVEKFLRTKIFEITDYVPSRDLDNFFVEAHYEMWTENIPALFELAEYLQKQDQIAIYRFSFGNTFKEYYVLLHPHTEDGEFVFCMDLTRMKKEYKHKMPITDGTVKAAGTPRKTVTGGLKVDF